MRTPLGAAKIRTRRMASPFIEKQGTLVSEQPGALESARTGGSVWSLWLEKDQAVAVCFALTACVVHFLFNGGCRGGAVVANVIRRFTALLALFPGTFFRCEDSSYRLDRPRARRTPLRASARGHGHAPVPHLPDHGQFLVHERI